MNNVRVAVAWGILVCAVVSAACSPEPAKRRHLENGERFLASGKLDEAILEFRNAVERDKIWGEARDKLAEAYALNGEAELAYRRYIRAADLLPDDGTAQVKAATYLLISP